MIAEVQLIPMWETKGKWLKVAFLTVLICSYGVINTATKAFAVPVDDQRTQISTLSKEQDLPSKVWQSTWRVGAFVSLWGISYAPFVVFSVASLDKAALDKQLSDPLFEFYVESSGTASILATSWVMHTLVDQQPFETLGFQVDSALKDGAIGLGVGGAWLGTAIALLALTDSIETNDSSPDWDQLPLKGASTLANVITQELLINGYPLEVLTRYFGSPAAVTLTSALFALLHAGAAQGEILPLLNVFVAGVLLGSAKTLSGNLWFPITIHFAWNLLLGPVMGMTVSGMNSGTGWHWANLKGPDWLTGGPFGLEGGLATTLATLVALGGLYLVYMN